jgi:hypothetical protein
VGYPPQLKLFVEGVRRRQKLTEREPPQDLLISAPVHTKTMSADHTRDPCPIVILNDFGGAFAMGVCLSSVPSIALLF